MIDERSLFDQPLKNNLITYHNIQKIATGQGDGYTTGCLLDYNYFNKNYKMIAIDLSKQQAFDVNPKTIQKISFTANFFDIEEVTETNLDFLQRTIKVF